MLSNDCFDAGLRRLSEIRARVRAGFGEVRMLGIPVLGGILVSGTRLLFPINGGTGRLGHDASLWRLSPLLRSRR